MLQKKFDEFFRDVNAGMERYTGANGLARRLVAEGHSDTVLIKEKQDNMRYVEQLLRKGWELIGDFRYMKHASSKNW